LSVHEAYREGTANYKLYITHRDIHLPLFIDDKDYCYCLRCSKNNAKRSEASAETADCSEHHEERPQKRRKQAVFKDFEEIVINVIGKL
jgi:hypothetical protein